MGAEQMQDVRQSLTEQVAEEIRVVMTRRRVRQSELSRSLGKSEQWVSIRLRGVQPIDLNDLQLIADALNVEVTDLIPQREGKLIAIGGTAPTTRRESKPWNFRMTKRPGPNGPRSRTAITASTTRTGRVLAAQAA